MLTLNVIGAGRVGQTLARLFHSADQFQIASVFTRTAATAQHASHFIGSGKAVHNLLELASADVCMLTVADDDIATISNLLLVKDMLKPRSIVFHCSGSKSSSILQPLRDAGHYVASFHPVRSFASPEVVVADFVDTYCGVEGDAEALAILVPAFEAIGARTFMLETEHKLRYHAASVFASNYLVTLMDIALKTYQAAGLSPEMAVALAQPLAKKTLENVFSSSTEDALTGPIKRGDLETVEKQLADLALWDQQAASLYQAFIDPTKAVANRVKRH
ncbi:DUF2520 domain-containing protein [Undibacterium sp. LX40W]|uniref:DUF2520 domain-containing protein n=1 Tax=Undibacterium nitidum TaxID=2762298 RepID=A0A923I000_9BURK|nr:MULTISPECIES: Rossmann-like and DUF2520 domain-containing protein [Undibacterium]MBC3883406.1 DUF2520 domain-containing protein [Undibacterium nitidum]MBC3893688.1 DUF2520 domain-containing protein [Undibacterium sp. LX40W]